MNQKEIWDKIAPQWNVFRQKPKSEVLDFLEDKKGKILDLGCGSGRYLILEKDATFYEVDFSEQMIGFAKQKAEKEKIKAKFFVGDLSKLQFKNNFFDSAIYIAALHCIPSEEQRKDSLKELLRVLKKDSTALITVWSRNHIKLVDHPKNATVIWKKQTEELQRYYYLYDKDELKELLKEVGFKILSSDEDKERIKFIVEKN